MAYLNTNNGYTIFEDGTKIEEVRTELLYSQLGMNSALWVYHGCY